MRHGFLLLDKPLGPSSHDMVYAVRRALGEKKVGHIGTLDPAASGLLVLAVGTKALRTVELFGGCEKRYTAEVKFGEVSSTYDREGVMEEVVLRPGQTAPDRIAIQNAIADKFLGKVSQVPPAASAINIGGERAYRKMRQGKPVDLPVRDIEISKCNILSFEYPNLMLDVECSSGTYIRSLAHDLGQTLRCGGYLAGLRRTEVGEWSVEDAQDPENVAWGHVIPLKEVLASLPRLDLDSEGWEKMRHGIDIEGECNDGDIAWFNDLPVAILTPGTKVLGTIHARKVMG